MSGALRSRIEESICSRDGVVTPTCFDPAMVLVARVLQQRYLAKFLNSSLYRKYLSELFSQIQTGPYKSGASGGGASTSGSGGGRKLSRRGFGLRRSGSNTSLSTCSSSEVSKPFFKSVFKLCVGVNGVCPFYNQRAHLTLPVSAFYPLGERSHFYAKHSPCHHVTVQVDDTQPLLVRLQPRG